MDSTLIRETSGTLREHVKAIGVGEAIETILLSVFVGEYEEAETLIDSLMQELADEESG